MKIFFILIYFLFSLSFIYSENNISIGIVPPFIRNESAETFFYNKHFTFEILFNEESNKFSLEIMNLDLSNNEDEYIKNSKNIVINNNLDLLLFSIVSSTDKYVFFKMQLINPYDDKILLNKIYMQKIDYTLTESLADCSKEIINQINLLSLQPSKKKIIKQLLDDNTKNNNENIDQIEMQTKHEIFFSNGFFKNHPDIISFLELITGYNYAPFNFFSIETGLIFGCGKYVGSSINLENYKIDTFMVGTYLAAFLFLRGFIEPSIGTRFELDYIYPTYFYLSLPIDIGIKIYIKNKYIIRLNTSFQFIDFNFFTLSWENNYIIGLIIGYATKI